MPTNILFKDLCRITERDHWSAIRAYGAPQDRALLREAIAAGKAGHKRQAYRMLGEVVRDTSLDEWAHVRKQAQKRRPPASTIRDLHRNHIDLSGGDTCNFNGDFANPGLSGNALYSFQYFGWTAPMMWHLILTGDAKAREWLIAKIDAYYAVRHKLPEKSGRDPRFCMLAMSGQQEYIYQLYLALLHTGEVPARTAEALLKIMLGLGRAMYRKIERFIVHNIHTASCFGLFILARHMPVFRESPRWEDRALRMLVEHTDRSYFSDGCHRERSWGYGEATLYRFRLAYEFAARTGGMGKYERRFRRNLKRAFRWYAKTMAVADICPGFGDGGIFKAASTIDAALRVFPEFKDRSLGVDQTRSYLSRPSGFAVMRNGHDAQSTYATLTFGEFPGWHGHFDCLSMNVWIGNTPVLDELGQFDSYAKPLDAIVRAPESHNQVLIDGAPYDSRIDEGARGVHCHSDERIDYFSGYHLAYRKVPDHMHRPHLASIDAIVRRTIVFVKDPGYLVVLDSVHTESGDPVNRPISAYWHAAAPYSGVKSGRARTRGRKACLLAWAYPETLTRMETSLDYTKAETSQFNPQGYGERHCLRARTWSPQGETPGLGFATLIVPFTGRAPDASIRVLPSSGADRFRAEALEVTTPAGRDVLILNPERIKGFTYRGEAVPVRATLRLGGGRGRVVVG